MKINMLTTYDIQHRKKIILFSLSRESCVERRVSWINYFDA
jgi:hypothetical protein